MQTIGDHPQRYALTNELHARPFPVISPPASAAFLAIKPEHAAAARDREFDRKHLVALLDRYGAPHPQPGATHYSGQLGKYHLKWESHTEFVTYTIFGDGRTDVPFDSKVFDQFPQDWLAEAPGLRITSALIHIEDQCEETEVTRKIDDWFVSESLAVSHVLDRSAVIAADFRNDAKGHTRFAVFACPGTGDRRVGRIVQRLCEIEIYKAMSMLGLVRVRELAPKIGRIDAELTALTTAAAEEATRPEETLKSLLHVSADLESMIARSSFRFGATGAYEALVNQRTEILREQRFGGRQTFSEFMMRRFDPAMRTVKSTERQMLSLAERAMRASDLLRTRVDVERSAQNQDVLASMDRRADLQLKLQRTVEGFSVAAISYYSVNLLGYLIYPLLEPGGLSKGQFMAMATPAVLLAVFFLVRHLRDRHD